jgi:hypothetical protein
VDHRPAIAFVRLCISVDGCCVVRSATRAEAAGAVPSVGAAPLARPTKSDAQRSAAIANPARMMTVCCQRAANAFVGAHTIRIFEVDGAVKRATDTAYVI